MFAINIENLKKLKYHIFLKKLNIIKKNITFLLFTVNEVLNMKKFKEEESIEILKILGNHV